MLMGKSIKKQTEQTTTSVWVYTVSAFITEIGIFFNLKLTRIDNFILPSLPAASVFKL